jgi:hypothetical protein
MNIPSQENGSGKCVRAARFIMPVENLVQIFGQNGFTKVQFSTGVSGTTYQYPDIIPPVDDSLAVVLTSSTTISSWQNSSGSGTVLQTFQYLVPESFLGKSLSQVAGMSALPKPRPTTKTYKCYTIDPKMDIVNDQIMIDTATGESLQDTIKKRKLEEAGGDPALAAALAGQAIQNTGVLPGDIEEGVLIAVASIGAFVLVVHLTYVIRLFMTDNFHDGQYQLMYFILELGIIAGISAALSVEKDKKDKKKKK